MNITVNYIDFRANHTLVSLEWTPEEGVQYTVSTSPQVEVMFISTSVIELMALYAVHYINLSVTATLCGQSNNETSTITLDLIYSEFDSLTYN